MFRKLLNVGKGHSAADKLQQQQQQQQQKQLFQLNEIRSYGFSHLRCLGYSPTLSLLAVGSKYGLLRVLGNASVEFSFQLESCNSIRQIEFIDCKQSATTSTTSLSSNNSKKSQQQSSSHQRAKSQSATDLSTPAKLIVLTDNNDQHLIHLFELKTCRQSNHFADNTTQTEGLGAENSKQQPSVDQQQSANAPEYTRLERVAAIDFFKFKPEDDDRSKRITTLEVSADNLVVFVGTEDGSVYSVPLDKFEPINSQVQDEKLQAEAAVASGEVKKVDAVNLKPSGGNDDVKERTDEEGAAAVANDDETTDVNLNDEPQIVDNDDVNYHPDGPFEMIKFDEHILPQLGDQIKSKKQGAIESIKKHPASPNKILLSYHRGLNVIFDYKTKTVDKYFYHNQILESSCFADQYGDFFYTSHNDGSYIKWDTRRGNQVKVDEESLGQLYGPYPCKPTPKIQAFSGLVNDQFEDLIFFSGGMPRATYDDKNPVTIVRSELDGKDTIKTVLDLTSKVLDFAVITRPQGNLGAGAKSTSGAGNSGGGGGKKRNKKRDHHHQQQQKQQQCNNPVAVALAILAEEEFVVIDLLNSESYLEFALPYLNCVHSSAITCNQHYSDISDELYEQLITYNKQQLKGKLSSNEWPITGGKVIDAPEVKTHDILLTGHEDGSVDFWDVSDLSMRHLLHLTTARFFSTSDDDLVPIEGNKEATDSNQDASTNNNNNEDDGKQDDNSSAWPPLKRVGRFDPYSDDTRLAIRKISLCPQTGTLVVAGTGGQVLTFELKNEASELEQIVADEITIVSDQRFTWKGREKLSIRQGKFKFDASGYRLQSYVQLDPPVAPTSLDLRSDWYLYAVGTSYGFLLYEYKQKHSVVTKCTLNVQDFAIVSGDAPGTGAMSRKKSFRKSLRESFRRLRRGRSQRNTPQPLNEQAGGGATAAKPSFGGPGGGRITTGVRTLNAPPPSGGGVGVSPDSLITGRGNVTFSTERQVEQKVELSSIVRCITLTSAVITNNSTSFKPTLWVGTNSGQVLVYAISLASEQQQSSELQQVTSAAASVAITEENKQPGQSQQEQAGVTQASPDPILTSAKLTKEIQLRHKAPIIAIFTTPDAPQSAPAAKDETAHDSSAKSSPEKQLPSELLMDGANQNSAADEQEAERPGSPATTIAPSASVHDKLSPSSKQKDNLLQPRVLICSEEQFKVFNLPNLKPFCKFKLTAHEGLRAKKISITQFLKPAAAIVKPQSALGASKSLQSFATQTSPPASPLPPAESESANGATSNKISNSKMSESNNNSLSTLNNNHSGSKKDLMNARFGAKTTSVEKQEGNCCLANGLIDGQQQQDSSNLFEPYMVCMSNQGDCAIYSVPDLKRQAQIQVCKREDVNGILSTMLTNYGEGYYLKSSSNFQRFSISTQRVLRVLSVV